MVIIQKDQQLMILYHVKVKYFIYLIECTLLFATCKYDNTTSSIVALTCALGTGRSTDASTNCTCISGYTEVQNQLNCAITCNQPCATCVSGSGTACLSCYDPNMNLNN